MIAGEGPTARRVDHVIVETADEAALFAFLTDTLALPIAWPVAQWGRFREGGASLGNCNVGCNHVRDPSSDPAPTMRRIALEPASPVAEVIEELDRRQLLLTPPIVSGEIDLPITEPYTPWRRGWTVVQLRTGLDPSPFICAYDHDVGERVRVQEAQLATVDGGRLGVTRLREVIIHTADVGPAISEWQSLFRLPGQSHHGVTFPSGPTLRFERGSSPPALVLGVRSMVVAIDALASLSISAELADDELRILPQDALGLDLRLVHDPTTSLG